MLTATERYKEIAAFALFLRPHCNASVSDRHLADTAATVWLQAKALHARYEADCSYQWADTDKYRKATDNLERKIVNAIEQIASVTFKKGHQNFLVVEFQHDPRGWPVTIKTTGDTAQSINIGG